MTFTSKLKKEFNWIRDLNRRKKTVEAFQKTIGERSCDLILGEDFSWGGHKMLPWQIRLH